MAANRNADKFPFLVVCISVKSSLNFYKNGSAMGLPNLTAARDASYLFATPGITMEGAVQYNVFRQVKIPICTWKESNVWL
jgi:hypothetical protein